MDNYTINVKIHNIIKKDISGNILVIVGKCEPGYPPENEKFFWRMITLPCGYLYPAQAFQRKINREFFLPAALQILLYSIKWKHQEQTETNRNHKEQ